MRSEPSRKTFKHGDVRSIGSLTAVVATMLMAVAVPEARADGLPIPAMTFGAGLRTDFTHTDNSAPSKDSSDFNLDSVRLYINGTVTDNIKFTFNTEYDGSSDNIKVLDAIGRFEYSDKLNIWAGRFLPPSDRANLYGPYYANNWKVYTDGVQDGYPATYGGRDNGAAYWGQFGKLKVSAGVFDVPSTTGSNKVLTTARLQLDLWDPEAGYYLNGTYYGDKDLLAFGVAGQTTADEHAFSGDILMEKKLPNMGVVSFESEYTRYEKLGGYGGYDGSYTDSNGYYGLLAYLFPQTVGIGKFQVLGKYARAKFDASPISSDPVYAQRTGEVDLNYIIKTFNARFSLFYENTSYDAGLPNSKEFGVGLQLQI